MKKILVVDDEVDIAHVLATRLEKEGFEVAMAYRGQEAIKKAGEILPDLIILDIMLPDIQGNEIAEVLKESPKTADIPIIFLSAMLSKSEQNLEPKSGHVIFAKPYDHEVLLKKIHQVITSAKK